MTEVRGAQSSTDRGGMREGKDLGIQEVKTKQQQQQQKPTQAQRRKLIVWHGMFS